MIKIYIFVFMQSMPFLSDLTF